MNYLAHLFLSGNNAELAVGNFIADAVKGDDHKNFPPGIRNGILLHRRIDEFTDHHPLVHKSKQHFVKQFDKYSGVLIDVFYDHFLAKNFSAYSEVSLNDFAAERYKRLHAYYELFPEKSKAFYGYMTGNNILVAYANPIGIEKVLEGLTSRIAQRSLLYNAMPDFALHYTELEEDFFLFFEELGKYVDQISIP
ncbi:MAG: ACP phosphodiesterase [Bacteroidia bacterium]